MFNINIDIIIRQLLPPHKRSVSVLEFLKCLSIPLKRLYNQFYTYRIETIKRAYCNSQVINLTYALNDRFNQSLAGITIVDGVSFDRYYLFNKREEREPFYLSNRSENVVRQSFRNRGEYNSQYDFIVQVPCSITFNEAEMRSFINQYKLAGKRFSIVTI